MEILAPIKNLENAKIAIKNGADALYLASPNFGARVNASMNLDKIKDIIELAKSYEVKTYITFNIVVFDNELLSFFYEVNCIANYGATGIIIQDFALIEIVKKFHPNLEVHASTQMHIHNLNAVDIVKNLGVNQVVVPREMSFKRIKNIKDNSDIKVESFVHGALCVCYSGQCYDSTLLDQKSANRGRCSQYCRMPSHVYSTRKAKVVSKGEYPLNLKDLNNLDNLDKYKEALVDVLKIEGRLKGIDYVGLTTKNYKEVLLGKNIGNKKEQLKQVYNRTFTNGRIAGINGRSIVNLERPNNTGLKIGEIKKVSKNNNTDLGFYKYKIFLETSKKISKGDNLRFVLDKYETGQEVEQLELINNEYVIYSNAKADVGSLVFKTKDGKLIDDFQKSIATMDKKRMKIKVNLNISLSGISYIINNDLFKSDIKVEKSVSNPLRQEQVVNTLSKTKNTNYDIEIKSLKLEPDLFLPNKFLKKLRDNILQNFEASVKTADSIVENEKKMKDVKEYLESYSFVNKKESQSLESSKIEIKKNKLDEYYFTIRTKEQLDFFLELNKVSKKTYTINIIFSYMLAHSLIEEEQIAYIEKVSKIYKTYLLLPRVIYSDNEEALLQLIKYFNNLCISEIGSLKYKNLITGDIITNFTFNTTNQINQKKLEELGVDKQMLSIELNFDKINKFSNDGSIINIYGSIPVMLMDYCPINLNKTNTCGSCVRCRSNTYSIRDNLGREFPLVYEGNSKIGLYTKEVLSLFDELDELNKFSCFYLNLVMEDKEDIKRIIKSIDDKKNYIRNSFKGNYYKNVL